MRRPVIAVTAGTLGAAGIALGARLTLARRRVRPADEVSRFLCADGEHTMVYSRTGEGDPVFVLVHGLGMGHRVFGALAADLAEHGTVYAVDLPGFGDSPDPGSALSMSGTGDLLAEFVAGLGLRDPVLVGHSMGTEVVVEAIAGHPGLSACAVLIAPTVNRDERTAPRQAMRMMQDLAVESPVVLAAGLVQYLKTGPRWFVRKLARMLEHEVERVYPRVGARVLVLRGEVDRVCPRGWVRQVADLIPDSTFAEVPGRGHEAMIRSPQPVADMILAHVDQVVRDRTTGPSHTT